MGGEPLLPGQLHILEAIGSLVQAARRRARGYRTREDLIAIAYLVAGKLDFATHMI